jgi:hypothetical protein
MPVASPLPIPQLRLSKLFPDIAICPLGGTTALEIYVYNHSVSSKSPTLIFLGLHINNGHLYEYLSSAKQEDSH